MIKYKLFCKKCNNTFDSWFASSQEYEKLKKKKLLNCINCNSIQVDKTLMAPKLLNKKPNSKYHQDLKKFKEMSKIIKNYQKFIKNNFEYVVKILLMRQDLFITRPKKKKKGSLAQLLKKKLKN